MSLTIVAELSSPEPLVPPFYEPLDFANRIPELSAECVANAAPVKLTDSVSDCKPV